MTGLLVLARPHVSLLDGPRLAWWLSHRASIRGAIFPVDPAYARHAVWSRLLGLYGRVAGGHRMVALDTESPFGLRSLAKALQHGQTVVLFPQGTGLQFGPDRPDRPGLQWLLDRTYPRIESVRMGHPIFVERSTEEMCHA